MLSVKQAEEIILNLVQPLAPQRDAEIVDLLAASGRILATEVISNLDFPHWDNSAMDGYAVRYADVAGCSAEKPAVLEIVEEIPAGRKPEKFVQTGQAARIFTGAMLPEGADTIVMQEVTQREGDRIIILASPSKPQAFVRHRGSYHKAGAPLLSPGIELGAAEIAILASAQCTQIPVYRLPRVAIFSTGDELVMPDRPLAPGQLVDSNQYALATLVAQGGGIPQMLGIVPDDPEKLQEAISQAIASADVVISSGGVSVGDYDYVDKILASLGAEIHIRSIAIKPGKPLTFATFRSERLTEKAEELRRQEAEGNYFSSPQSPVTSHQSPVIYFGLPGNPASSVVTFWRFVQPALKKLSGLSHSWQPIFVQARNRQDLRSDGKRESYYWGKLHLVDGLYEFELAAGSQISGNLINLAQTNGLAILPIEQTLVAKGETVTVLQVNPPVID